MSFYCGVGLSHSFAQLPGNPHDDAFDTLGREADPRKICDSTSGKPGAIVEPEYSTVTILVRSRNAKFKITGDLLDQNCAFYGFWASGGVLSGGGNKIFLNLLQLAGAALLAVGSLEMIANHVGGHYLYVAGKSARVLLFKATEGAKVVGTEPEICLLNEIVYGLL